MKHLWEVNHSYYMTEGNYFSTGCHYEYKRWADFIADWGSSDMDYNYVTRFDWLEDEEPMDEYYMGGRLMIQVIGQRKAKLQSTETIVCRKDEAAVIEFLKPRFEYAMQLWAPFNTEKESDNAK